MFGLPDILRQCRDVVAEHHPLTKTNLIASIDARLSEIEATSAASDVTGE
jgi:hypothetical protein